MESKNPITIKMSDSGFSTSTSKPWGTESFSIFGDGSCGEPFMAQHLVVDFTPLDEVDNDFVQRKCCAFWDFINSQPELQQLMVLPESNIYRKNLDASDFSSELKQSEIAKPIPHVRTAVSMLEIVEGKGLIDRTFEAKLQHSQCTLGSREYHDNDNIALPPVGPSHLKDKGCICSGSCITCFQRRASNVSVAASSPGAVDLCRTMDEWDTKHPKSMDPPGHPPALSQCVMQRNIIS